MGGKILGIGGSMKKEGSSSGYLLSAALEAARTEPGVETEQIRLADYHILPCRGCGDCMAGRHCPLLNDPEDQYRALFEKFCEADGLIFASPVYALSLPAVWKNWLDRCEPCSDEDLDFEYYNYDRVMGVKGKALRGKVAGQIAVAAGPGHEWAMASMIPAFTCARLSMIASAGISLIEYDSQPGVREKPWSKPIQEAAFAIDMARGVGLRVASALGFSYFDAPGVRQRKGSVKTLRVEDLAGNAMTLEEFARGAPLLAVATDRENAEEAQKLFNAAKAKNGCRLCMVVGVGPLVPGIDKSKILKNLRAVLPPETLVDWKGDLPSAAFGGFPLLVNRSETGEWSVTDPKAAGALFTGADGREAV